MAMPPPVHPSTPAAVVEGVSGDGPLQRASRALSSRAALTRRADRLPAIAIRAYHWRMLKSPLSRLLILGCAAAILSALLLTACEPEYAPPPPPPAAMALIPPLHDAEPGEMLRLRRGGAQVNQYRVVSVTDLAVEVETIRYDERGEPMGPATTESWSRNGWGLPPGGVIRAFEQETVVIAKRSYACWRIDYVLPDAGKFYYWIDSSLPVNGLVRVARDTDGKPELENAFVHEYSEFPE